MKTCSAPARRDTWVRPVAAVTLIIALAAVSARADAEYRCAKPQQLEAAERRACELARRPTPAALIRFVNKTKAIYGLYVDDYIGEADVDRWDLAQRESPAIANVPSSEKTTATDR